jgi:hypothetical protein
LAAIFLIGSLPAVSQADTFVCGTIDSNTTWSLAGSPYVLTCSVTVASGATLTIAPGVVVKGQTGSQLVVEGTLVADGAVGASIVFTSYPDDTVGGDTNGDGPSTGSPGQWVGIGFGPGSLANVLDRVEVRYAGDDPNAYYGCWYYGVTDRAAAS